MAFLDVSFPLRVASGATVEAERRTDIVALGSGREERNARWYGARLSWDAGTGIRDGDDLAAVVALYHEARGRLHAFRFRDPLDHKSGVPSAPVAATNQSLGTGDASRTAFQLVKRYGTLDPWVRPITKPVAGSVVVALGGVVQASGWSVDFLSGVVTFVTPPGDGVAVSAGFAFDVAVRFDTDRLEVEAAYFDATRGVGQAPRVPLIEVLGE